jgi:hypothetical protein
MKRVAILMGVWLLLVQPAYSQLSMTVRGQPVTITFDSTLTNVNLRRLYWCWNSTKSFK